jgi:putative copper export protein/mono/diheme cytochrome c family protein
VEPLETAVILLRGAHLATLLLLFGGLLFRAVIWQPHLRAPGGGENAFPGRLLPVAATLSLALGLVWLLTDTARIAEVDTLPDVLAALPVVMAHTRFGMLLTLRLLALVVILALSHTRGRVAPGAAIGLAAIAVGLEPWFGHAAAVGGRPGMALALCEAAHLLAAGAWIGGLLPLLLCLRRLSDAGAAMLSARFTPLGLAAVGMLLVTALPLTVALVGGLPGLIGTPYGRVLLAKLSLFALALALAAANRLILVPSLRGGRTAARRWLMRSIQAEAVIGLAVVMLAGALAALPPAAHEQPVWPFALRPSMVALEEPVLRDEVVGFLFAAAAALLGLVASLWFRRLRILAIAGALALVVPRVSALGLLLVEAYPTSYWLSPTGFSAASIARGQGLFQAHCAVCHLAQDGTDSAGDLTAAHLWEHRDGELFWWLVRGITDPDGNQVMPPFADTLSDEDRWALIDFIRARNLGQQGKGTGQWLTAAPAPDVPIACVADRPGGLRALRGRPVRFVADDGSGALRTTQDGALRTTEDGALRTTQDGALRTTAIPDVATVLLTRGQSVPPVPGVCVAASPAAWDAFAVLTGQDAAALNGVQIIVDADGWLRAWLPAGVVIDRLTDRIGAICATPVAGSSAAGHVHRH